MSESISYIWKEIRAPKKLTYKEFQLIPYDGLGHHLVKGVHIITPAPGSKHQWISSIISQKLGNFIENKQIGRVITAPYDVKFSGDSGFQPDLLVIMKENYNGIKENFFEGRPLLIIEIVSPGSSKDDYVWKKEMAEEFKVPEYWVCNIEEKIVDLFYLENDKYKYKVFRENSKLESTLKELKGFEMDLKTIFGSLNQIGR